MSGIGFLLVGFKFGLGVFLNKGSYAIENEFDVLKASLDSIGILLHCTLVTIMKQSSITWVCFEMTGICEASRLGMVNWHAC